MEKTPTTLVQDIEAVLRGHPDVAFAYLFGSQAKGKTRPSSDVDVAVFLAPAPADDLTRQFEFQDAINAVVGIPTDVIILNIAPPALAFIVLHTGIPILIRDKAAHRVFYVKQAQNHYDMEPARGIFAQYMNKRLEGGVFGGGRNRDTPSPRNH